MTSDHLGFMQNIRDAHSCRLGSQAEFVQGRMSSNQPNVHRIEHL